jgi:hypothetical protein
LHKDVLALFIPFSDLSFVSSSNYRRSARKLAFDETQCTQSHGLDMQAHILGNPSLDF